MNQSIWTASAIADLKEMPERRARRLRREADLALGRFGRALIRNIAPVPGLEGVYVFERGGLRVFFRYDAQAETVTTLKAQDVRTARGPTDRARESPPPKRRTAPGQAITLALEESLIGLAKEEAERGWLGEGEEEVFLGRLAALALSQYLRNRGLGLVTSETGYMADPHLAALLGLAEVDVAGMSIAVCTTIDEPAHQARIPRAAFEAGFISDYYVFAQVAEDLSYVQFYGFITDEDLEASRLVRSQGPEVRGQERGRGTPWLLVTLDQLWDMAKLESELRTNSREQRAIEGTLPIPEASDLVGSLTSMQLGEELFGEMAHERARDLHFSWLKGSLVADDERPYLGHVLGCVECRTELFNFLVLREELEELHAALSRAPSAELAVAEPHIPAHREIPKAVEFVPAVEEAELAVPMGSPLARVRNGLMRTLSASWTWAREHPVPAVATSAAFAAGVIFLLSTFLKAPDVKEQQLRRARTPYLVQVSEPKPGTPSVLTISNAAGGVIYTEAFPAGTGIAAYEKPVDLNGDGDLEVVFALNHQHSQAVTGRIFVYSFDEAFLTGRRDRPLMAPPFNTYHQLHYSYFPTPWSGSSWVDKLVVDDLKQNGQPRIVLIWRDTLYAGSALTVLRLPGKVEQGLVREAEYMNPGHIYQLMVVTIGGQKKIVIAGLNDALRGTQLPFGQADQYYPFIALLDPREIWGEAPPYLQNEQGKGSHKWYGYFTPTGFSVGMPWLVDIDADGKEDILVRVNSPVPHPRAVLRYTTFYLDLAGRLIKEELGDFPPPKKVTYHLYDSSQVWWLGKDEYERRYKLARRKGEW